MYAVNIPSLFNCFLKAIHLLPMLCVWLVQSCVPTKFIEWLMWWLVMNISMVGQCIISFPFIIVKNTSRLNIFSMIGIKVSVVTFFTIIQGTLLCLLPSLYLSIPLKIQTCHKILSLWYFLLAINLNLNMLPFYWFLVSLPSHQNFWAKRPPVSACFPMEFLNNCFMVPMLWQNTIYKYQDLMWLNPALMQGTPFVYNAE